MQEKQNKGKNYALLTHYCECDNGHVFDDPVPFRNQFGEPNYGYWVCPVCGAGFVDVVEDMEVGHESN